MNKRTLKSLVGKDLESMSQKELRTFAVKSQSVLAELLAKELRKEAAYEELKACTKYRSTKEIKEVCNTAELEVACGLDLDIAQDYNEFYSTGSVLGGLSLDNTIGVLEDEEDDLDRQMKEDAANLQGVIQTSDDLIVDSVCEDELKYWMNGVNQIDGYAVVDGEKLYFQASSSLAGPTVIGDWKHNRKIKEMIESKVPNFFKPKWESIDEYKVYTTHKDTKCMVTALNHERTKFMGYIGEYAWIWDLKKTDFRGNAFKPLITLGKELIEGRSHSKDFEAMNKLREQYTNTIQGLISVHKDQVKSGKKTFARPANSSTSANTNKIGGGITSDSGFKLNHVSDADMKKQMADLDNMVLQFRDAETDEPVNVTVNQKTNRLSLSGEIIF